MSLPELCLGYRGSDSTSVASSLRPTYYMYLSPGVGAFNPEAGGKHTANGESYNAGWRYVQPVHRGFCIFHVESILAGQGAKLIANATQLALHR